RALVPELPRAVDLVAEAPELHVVGRIAAVLAPLIGPVRVLRFVRVLHPMPGIVDRAEAQVEADIGLRADTLRVAQEPAGAEPVPLEAVPGQLQTRRALIFRADAVGPGVARREVAARPSQHRDAEGPDGLHHVLAVSVRVGERAALFVDAAVDHSAE